MCDTVVVVEADRVLFAKNSDRDPNEAQVLDWQPARDWPEGSEVRCTHVAIPQARRTNAVLLSRPFWMWGAEMGVNEHDVAIGNEAVFTRAPVPDVGLTGMDLVRLALERASTAEEAVSVLVELAGRHGQGGRCGHENPGFRYHSSFLVADPRGAFVLETAGPEHAVERVVGARAISNGLTIPGFASRGRWLHEQVSACRTRRARLEGLAQGALRPEDLFRALRDHGGEEPVYRLHHGGMGAVCMHAGGWVAASQTTGSWVSELRAGGSRHWATGTAAPCISLFKPVRLDAPLDLGRPTDRADDSLWWRHERVHRRIIGDRAARAELGRACAEIEARWARDPVGSREAFAEGDRLLARWADRVGEDGRPWFVRRYWAVRNQRAGVGGERAPET